jgi:hypothetical protein
MNFITIEAPASRVSASGKTLKLLDAALRIVIGKRLEIIADQLIKALAKRFSPLAGSCDNAFVNR